MGAVVCLTSDRYLWALQPFCYLFNTFWSEQQPVTVAGFSQPDFKLPDNFTFHIIDTEPYPKERWSNALIRFLNSYPHEHFVLLLEDYWLSRTVDVRGVAAAFDYLQDHPEVMRFDLTADRLYASPMRDVEAYGSYDIIETTNDAQYQMSLQAGIWNKRHLLNVLVPGKSAWEFELHLVPGPGMRVLGTRQWPVRYANAILKGKVDMFEVEKIQQPQRSVIEPWIQKEWEVEAG